VARKTASGDEAAAVAAAIARFEADTAAAPGEAPKPGNPWQRAALLEGVSAKEIVQDTQGGARWPS
jgi:hypothetical protein